jgi:hypothetical protein
VDLTRIRQVHRRPGAQQRLHVQRGAAQWRRPRRTWK